MFDANARSSVKDTSLAFWYLDQIAWTVMLQRKDCLRGKIPLFNWLTSKQTILKHEALSNEMMLQFRMPLNITKHGEMTAFIIKKNGEWEEYRSWN